MNEKTPFLLVGDSPMLSSGLARIARDVGSIIHQMGYPLASLGWDATDEPWPWPCFKITDHESWGEKDLPKIWYKAFGNRPGIVLTIWDPSRCYHTTQAAAEMNIQLWGYFPIDSENRAGKINGPAEIALRRYQRVLAYGRYGAQVLKETLARPIQWLPHGLDAEIWKPSGEQQNVVGAVATNIHRKDLGLLFGTWRILADRDPSLLFWLHTNAEVGPAWSVPQLAEDFGFEKELLVTTPETVSDDATLAALYSRCLCTIAPGLGEGFGYPIVESLSCGVPAIHIDFAGGSELLPRADWRVRPSAWRLEGHYVQKRPVLAPEAMAAAAWRAIEWKRREPAVVAAYCRGSVEHLSWRHLAKFWQAWLLQGLKEQGCE